ncbi:MAG: hypothetical protein Q7S27_05460 [Nanoarchaeota archaeon]|nr:hypothetical protein [Nanoarchaeota archaeon]
MVNLERHFICAYNSPYKGVGSQFFIYPNVYPLSPVYRFLLNRDRIECYSGLDSVENEFKKGRDALKEILSNSAFLDKSLASEKEMDILYKIMKDSEIGEKISLKKRGRKPLDLRSENKIINLRRAFDDEESELAYRKTLNAKSRLLQ